MREDCSLNDGSSLMRSKLIGSIISLIGKWVSSHYRRHQIAHMRIEWYQIFKWQFTSCRQTIDANVLQTLRRLFLYSRDSAHSVSDGPSWLEPSFSEKELRRLLLRLLKISEASHVSVIDELPIDWCPTGLQKLTPCLIWQNVST